MFRLASRQIPGLRVVSIVMLLTALFFACGALRGFLRRRKPNIATLQVLIACIGVTYCMTGLYLVMLAVGTLDFVVGVAGVVAGLAILLTQYKRDFK